MEKSKNIIGVDLGGTNIRVGKVIDDQIVKVFKEPTPSEGTKDEVLEKLYFIIKNCLDTETQYIGIGVPSVVDTVRGIVYDVVNIPSWKEVALRDFLFEKFNVPVHINNDSNCFVAGEKIYGKGRSYDNIIGMTIGTGLGLGLIFNGKLYEGRNCGAGEFGMIPYLDNILETYCSGQFFSKIKNVNGIEIYQKARADDKNALIIYEEFGKHVGMAVKSILYAYDPDIIIIGGSLAGAFDLYKTSMYKEIESFEYKNTLQNIRIEISELPDSAILGAAALGNRIMGYS